MCVEVCKLKEDGVLFVIKHNCYEVLFIALSKTSDSNRIRNFIQNVDDFPDLFSISIIEKDFENHRNYYRLNYTYINQHNACERDKMIVSFFSNNVEKIVTIEGNEFSDREQHRFIKRSGDFEYH